MRNGNIISNSSSGASFSWEASLGDYQKEYGGPGKFYRIPTQQRPSGNSPNRAFDDLSSNVFGNNENNTFFPSNVIASNNISGNGTINDFIQNMSTIFENDDNNITASTSNNNINVKSLQTQASYDRKVLAIQPIIIEKPITMPQQSSSISFIGGGVNSSDNNKSRLFVG